MAKLTALEINRLKHRSKAFKVFDGEGLFLLVHPNGSKYWRLKYRLAGKEKTVALGVHGKGGVSPSHHLSLSKHLKKHQTSLPIKL